MSKTGESRLRQWIRTFARSVYEPAEKDLAEALSAAESRGYERAREQAARSLEALGGAHSGTMYERTCSQHAERIRAMTDGGTKP